MIFEKTKLAGVVIVEPRVFEDARGFFMETYHQARFAAAGIDLEFVQDNHTQSVQGTLRGLHYQIQHPQGKLVRAVRGEVYDVVVDLRRKSATFGQWIAVTLSESNRRQLYVPPGFAHGFCVVSPIADVTYKCTDLYYPEYECSLLWNDPQLAIRWPCEHPLLSEKDRAAISFSQARVFDV